jgi:hypothetical protein
LCVACDRSYLKRGDIIKVEAVNWEHYSGFLKIREGSRAIVIPHNEFFFFKEKGFFEDPQDEVRLKSGQVLYDVVMPDGSTLENVGYESPKHMVLYWSHRLVTNLEPLVKEIEDLSQTRTRALHWVVMGNRPPVWKGSGYVM